MEIPSLACSICNCRVISDNELNPVQKVLLVVASAVLILHGLIHLMGTTVYMKLGKIDEFLGIIWFGANLVTRFL